MHESLTGELDEHNNAEIEQPMEWPIKTTF